MEIVKKTKSNLILGDRVIREALLRRLMTFKNKPQKIIEELRVHNGNAIADIVTIHSDAHCYEIKGENDSIHRILQQCKFYDLTFRKITVVTTSRHRSNAERLAPEHWGIMIAKDLGGDVGFSYARPAKSNPNYDKKLALLTLWKSELAEVARSITDKKIKNLTRDQVSNLLVELLTKEDVSRHISAQLRGRFSKL